MKRLVYATLILTVCWGFGHVFAQSEAPASPDSVADYIALGVARSLKGDPERAIEAFNRAIELQPENAEAFYYRGLAHFYLDELDQAIDDYTHALDLEPGYALAYVNR